MARPPKPETPKRRLRRFYDEAVAGMARVATPLCPHFGSCGGCQFQDLDYAQQLVLKEAVCRRQIAEGPCPELLEGVSLEVVASPQPLGYRSRMDYVVAFNKCGLRQRGSHKWVEELTACPLLGPAFAAAPRAWALAQAAGLPSYNYLSHQGELRYVVIRRSRDGQVLVALVSKSEACAEAIADIARTLLDEGLASSVHWVLQDSLADVSIGRSLAHWGRATISETLLGLCFTIGPNTFFQSNAAVAELAYGRIVDFLGVGSPRLGLDLFSGTGTIAALLARICGQVLAVEQEPANCALAAHNLAINALDNVAMTCAPVLDWLRREPPQGVEALVLNPPRIGVGAETLALIRPLAIPRLASMSCNLASHLDDLAVLGQDYRIERLLLLDMFPQTQHFETLAFLSKR